MSAKFTPGPWSVKLAKHPSDGAHYFGVGATVGTNEQRIIGCFGRCYENGFPVAEANARLIAAAPDMYEAICGFLESGKATGGIAGLAVTARLAAAIAKAEGKL